MVTGPKGILYHYKEENKAELINGINPIVYQGATRNFFTSKDKKQFSFPKFTNPEDALKQYYQWLKDNDNMKHSFNRWQKIIAVLKTGPTLVNHELKEQVINAFQELTTKIYSHGSNDDTAMKYSNLLGELSEKINDINQGSFVLFPNNRLANGIIYTLKDKQIRHHSLKDIENKVLHLEKLI